MTDWRERSACKNANPDLFFSDKRDDKETAAGFCHQCPVMRECLALADSFESGAFIFGIFGGLTPEGRRKARHKRLAA